MPCIWDIERKRMASAIEGYTLIRIINGCFKREKKVSEIPSIDFDYFCYNVT